MRKQPLFGREYAPPPCVSYMYIRTAMSDAPSLPSPPPLKPLPPPPRSHGIDSATPTSHGSQPSSGGSREAMRFRTPWSAGRSPPGPDDDAAAAEPSPPPPPPPLPPCGALPPAPSLATSSWGTSNHTPSVSASIDVYPGDGKDTS